METVPVTPAARTTKVRAAKAAESKSSKPAKKSDAVKAEPAAAPVKRKTSTKKVVAPKAAQPADLTPMIATAAYFLAEQRHFAPGCELQDWLAAEQMIRSSPAFK
ncbi:MAG: DUF2934 domain-containing protein [Steroidobacteraceae bacterium]